jgi:hypothetical protein
MAAFRSGLAEPNLAGAADHRFVTLASQFG